MTLSDLSSAECYTLPFYCSLFCNAFLPKWHSLKPIRKLRLIGVHLNDILRVVVRTSLPVGRGCRLSVQLRRLTRQLTPSAITPPEWAVKLGKVKSQIDLQSFQVVHEKSQFSMAMNYKQMQMTIDISPSALNPPQSWSKEKSRVNEAQCNQCDNISSPATSLRRRHLNQSDNWPC